MRLISCPVLLIASLAGIIPVSGQANCDADHREVTLIEDNVVRLRSYSCRTGANPTDSTIRVEFHRLSDAAASLLVNQQPSLILRKTIGHPRLIPNDVHKAYMDLQNRFGQSKEHL